MLESARNFITRILHGRDALDLLPRHKSPSVAWLLAHREECRGKTALCEGTTPLASLYRMYEYIVTDSTIGLRNEMEEELRSRPRVLEREPSWVSGVPALEKTLVIPYDDDGKIPEEEARSGRFLEKNILVAEPHVLFG
jgi:hypothetical protein